MHDEGSINIKSFEFSMHGVNSTTEKKVNIQYSNELTVALAVAV